MRLSLLAVAIFVLVLATASACDNEELDRLMEEAPPPGATVIDRQQCTSGTLAAPTCATVWFQMSESAIDLREAIVTKHAESIGWTLVDRWQISEDDSVSLYFEREGYEAAYYLLSDSFVDLPRCNPPSETNYSLCLDVVSIDEK